MTRLPIGVVAVLLAVSAVACSAATNEDGVRSEPADHAPTEQGLPTLIEIVVGNDRLMVARTEATIAQYDACVASGICELPQYAGGYASRMPQNYPMGFLRKTDAEAFASYVSSEAGFACRLPTWVEWRDLAIGSEAIVANHVEIGTYFPGREPTFGNGSPTPYTLSPVGQLYRTEEGLFDLPGGIREWTSTCAFDIGGQCITAITSGDQYPGKALNLTPDEMGVSKGFDAVLDERVGAFSGYHSDDGYGRLYGPRTGVRVVCEGA